MGKIFTPSDQKDGVQKVTGDCNGIDAQTRYEVETPIFGDMILDNVKDGATILDYGVGVGRIAKYILEKNRTITVIGVDQYPKMREMATNNCLSDRLTVMSPDEYKQSGIVPDFAYCIYVLQHVQPLYLRDAIRAIKNTKSDKCLVVSSTNRMAITANEQAFGNDNIEITTELLREFSKLDWAIPFDKIMNNKVMRAMFIDGAVRHYSIYCYK